MDAMETDEPVLDIEVCTAASSDQSLFLPNCNLVFLQTYAAQFSGHGKIDRLLFIARKCKGQQLEVDALRLAAEELKKVICVLMDLHIALWCIVIHHTHVTDYGCGTLHECYGQPSPVSWGGCGDGHVCEGISGESMLLVGVLDCTSV